MQKRVVALSVLLPGLLAVSGCGGSVSLSTTCSDYLNKSATDQKKLAQAYLEQVVGEKSPGAIATFAAETGLTAYCRAHEADQLKDIHI